MPNSVRYQGFSCPHGHTERYVKSNRCVACSTAAIKRWAIKNAVRKAETRRVWRLVNKDRLQIVDKAYRAKNSDKEKARAKAWYLANKERSRRKSREWLAANKERYAKATRRWREANRSAVKVAKHRRRAKERGAEGFHTEYDLFCIFAMQDAQCNGCGKSLLISCTEDHIIPLSRGGSDWPDNIQLLCSWCNDSKGVKLMSEWRQAA